MASVRTILFLVIILVLQTLSATSYNISSIFPPFFGGDVCKSVECGKGTCKPSKDSNFGFACECDAGWKQARPEHDDGLKFLPCVIPNCTVNYSCTQAPSPAPAREKRANESIFDPCYWADCGGGTCSRTSPFTHKCDCREGYYNILNVTAFPCLRECALGTDCKHLGIGITNTSTSPPPSSPDNGQNQGGDVCKSAECGKGTCKPSNNSNFGFACECDAGWKQARSEDDDSLKFLPCVIPNCTVNYSCTQAPSPAPAREKPSNESIFDPCFWADCGGGTCSKTSPFTHKCNCQEGYYNILNVTAFPCLRECALGTDCKYLGIGITNTSTSSHPNLPDNSQNQATSIAVGGLTWSVFTMVLYVAFILSE